MRYSQKVLDFAAIAHQNQVRKFTGAPYITHPIAVAEIAAKNYNQLSSCNSAPEIIRSIGYLHDVIEDTHITPDDLQKFLKDLIDSQTDDSPNHHHIDEIYKAVMLLTKSKTDFDLFNYLDAIKGNFYALIVKLADNEHNSSDLKDQKKLEYYKLIRYYLTH